jgi:FAD:protein FMN transferase
MSETIQLRRRAMATVFELWLVGGDREHLEAVGQEALAEVARIESLLSRFDPRAELARVNREAARGAVLVEVELFEVLRDCAAWWERTNGYFDIRAYATPVADGAGRPRFEDAVELDESQRTVRFSDSAVTLDLGGYGKGYALDSAARIVREFGVESALMHGGTSSAVAMGRRADGGAWTIGIRDPFGADRRTLLTEIELQDCGYSHSAVFGERPGPSDVIDPHAEAPLAEQAACFVITPAAADAEVYSTALLSMGRSRAQEFLESSRERTPPSGAAWIATEGPKVTIRWLTPVTGAR